MPALLQARDIYDECWNDGNTRYCRRSAWNDWVRWLVLVLVVLGFFLLFVVCSCITARRRRKAGRQPYYGTGWIARPGNNAQPYYNNNQYSQPAPPYTPQPNQPYGANQGYYGQQQGVELQQPQPTYNRGDADNVYAPPAGPPPGKH